jgi:regulator of sigma E protease
LTGNPGIAWTLLSFLLVIGPLVFIHEMGHYLVGRWFGVKADAFSIGFGREIAGWTDKRGTRWKVGWLPLGGYVRFAGDMNAASEPSREWLELPPEERERTFQAKPVWQRFLIVLAGPATNLIFALLVLTGFVMAYGEPRTPPLVAKVIAGSAAEQAGLRAGDRITAIDSSPVARYEDIGRLIVLRANEIVRVSYTRDGRSFTVEARPKVKNEKDEFGNEFSRGVLGVERVKQPVIEPVPLVQAVPTAARQIWYIVSASIEGVGQIIAGTRSVSELGGPVKIAKYSGEQASLGPVAFLWFIAVISINLGFINLLPIPLLDGGHLFFYTVEAIRRKPLKPEAQEWAFRTGLAVLLALMVFVTLNDLSSFGLWSKLGGLIG